MRPTKYYVNLDWFFLWSVHLHSELGKCPCFFSINLALWNAWVMYDVQIRDYKDVFRSMYKDASVAFDSSEWHKIRENVICIDCFASEIILGCQELDKMDANHWTTRVSKAFKNPGVLAEGYTDYISLWNTGSKLQCVTSIRPSVWLY